MDGFAASWYNRVTKDGTQNLPTTWAHFKADLLKRFQPDDYKKQLKLQLGKRKLGREETLEDYFNSVMTLCDKNDRDMDDNDVINKLRNGLYPEMLARLAMSRAKTPIEFLSDMQKVNSCLRIEVKNRATEGERRVEKERVTEVVCESSRPKHDDN